MRKEGVGLGTSDIFVREWSTHTRILCITWFGDARSSGEHVQTTGVTNKRGADTTDSKINTKSP